MASPEEQGALKLVFWSTRDSIDNEIPSVSAIIETIVAVPIYWWVAIYFETYLPLLISVAVAPLVLLRSDQSVARGAMWFTAWVNQLDAERSEELRWYERQIAKRAFSGAFLTLVLGVAGFLIHEFVSPAQGWAKFVYGVLILLLVMLIAGLLSPVVALTGAIGRRSIAAAMTKTVVGAGVGATLRVWSGRLEQVALSLFIMPVFLGMALKYLCC
jgi:hypothetical protein